MIVKVLSNKNDSMILCIWCFNTAVLSEAAHFGSMDLDVSQLSVQRAVPGEKCEDASP